MSTYRYVCPLYNTLHHTPLNAVLTQSQENDPFEKKWVQNTHLFSSAWRWQHNVLMTYIDVANELSVYVMFWSKEFLGGTRHTQICYFTCKLGSSLPVWSNSFCSFELKLLHSFCISFPYVSWLKQKRKLNEHSRLL